MRIAIDIDGILTVETEGWGRRAYADRTPNLKAIERVRLLNKAGYDIILFSARHEEDREVTLRWLEENNVLFNELILDKPQYNVLVDDLAINNIEEVDDFLGENK